MLIMWYMVYWLRSGEEIFDFYFVAGYTSGGMSYGIKIEGVQDQGLLEEDKKYLKAF